jgi:zinc/manganese transport system substrate-binding protein
MFPNWRTASAVALAASLLVTACGDDSGGTAPRGDCPIEPVRIVVSVSQWGDIVNDLAGDCGQVTTVISGTSVDPHDFEPTPADLAAFDDARLVVVNGLGYDAWAEKAADASSSQPAVVNAGDVVGKSEGDNPHLWYGPDFVTATADTITAELQALAPNAGSYFEQRATAWRTSMQPYFDEVENLRSAIGAKSYAATEPVFDYMAQAVGLVDETPTGFTRSAANEIDPSPADIHDFQVALTDGSVDVLVYNTQTEGAVPTQLRSTAESAGVPIVDVTESPPPDSSFVSWQVGQLTALAQALGG